jgi:hypothetical protein
MFRIFFAILFICQVALAIAQQPHPCGTHDHMDEWYLRYTADPSSFPQERNTMLYIPVTVHMVGTDNGTGFYPTGEMLESLCRVNLDYDSAGMYFFIEGDIRYINNTGFYAHSDIVDGANYMFQYNVPNTMNSYVVADAAGNCGYNMKFAGNIMAAGCMDGHTWAHEIGHYFNVQHPFLGWEGKVYNPAVPTPLFVYYDYTNFWDTLWGNDTTIIDTAEVEFVDRSNCLTSADRLCDTQADYIAQRWTCNGQQQSSVLQTDPNGTTFRSDGRLIMSYSDDVCQQYFSADQISLMRAYLQNERANLLANQNPFRQPITVSPTGIYPAPNAVIPGGGATFRWNSVPGATHYVLQVARNSTGSLLQEIVTTDTFFVSSYNFTTLPANWRYLWRVKPFNQGYFCADYTANSFFTAQTQTGINQPLTDTYIKVYPNPVTAKQALNLEIESSSEEPITISLYNALGQLAYGETFRMDAPKTTLQIDTNALSSGIYLLQVKVGNSQQVQRVVVH